MMAVKRRWSSVLIALITLVAVLVISSVIAGIGIRMAGSMAAFQENLSHAGFGLLLWRLTLYVALGYYWWGRARPRVLGQLKNSAHAAARLRRLERLIIVALLVLEALNVMRLLGGQ